MIVNIILVHKSPKRHFTVVSGYHEVYTFVVRALNKHLVNRQELFVWNYG